MQEFMKRHGRTRRPTSAPGAFSWVLIVVAACGFLGRQAPAQADQCPAAIDSVNRSIAVLNEFEDEEFVMGDIGGDAAICESRSDVILRYRDVIDRKRMAEFVCQERSVTDCDSSCMEQALAKRLAKVNESCSRAAAPPPSRATAYVGCLAENNAIDPVGLQGRALAGHCITSASAYAGKCAASSPMTVDRCVSECGARGFQFAGVQYRDWCFCGNSVAQARSLTACTMPCAGNPSQICGGPSANSVYRAKR